MERVYEVLDVLGRGGFGVVYRCRYRGAHGFFKEVAVKCLLPSPDRDAGEEFLRRFRDEARLLGLLRHRAIVSVDRLVRVNSAWAVVMEYVDGVDLSRIIDACGPLPDRVALEIAADVAGALDYASRAPGPSGQPLALLHRDIKPANIQLTVDGQTKVLDFGIARAEWEHREAATQDLRFGSPPYMSPERFRGFDHPSGDVYALGAVLYPLLAGVSFGGARQTNVEHDRFVQTRLAELAEARPLHSELRHLLERMLAGHPDQRPPANEVEQTCRRLLAELPARPDLRDFAAVEVPKLRRAVSRDPAVGTTLREQSETILEVSGPVETETPGLPVSPAWPVPVPGPPPPKQVLEETGALPASPAKAVSPPRGPTETGAASSRLAQPPTAATVKLRPAPPPDPDKRALLAAGATASSDAAFPTGATALGAPEFPAAPAARTPMTAAPRPQSPTPSPRARPVRQLAGLLIMAVLGASGVAAVLLAVAFRPTPEAASALPSEPRTPPMVEVVPESEPTPNPEPTPPPSTPVDAPRPSPQRAEARASIQLTEDGARVELRGSTTVPLPGKAPPGTYTLWADYGDGWEQGQTLTLSAGQAMRVVCTARFHACEINSP